MKMWNKDEPPDFFRERWNEFQRSSQEGSAHKRDVPESVPLAREGMVQKTCEFPQPPAEDVVPEAPAGEDESRPGRPDDNSDEKSEISPFGPQLTSLGGVGKDMGTIALERFPAERLHQGSAGRTMSTRPNEGFGQLTDAEIMLRAGAGDNGCFEYLAAKYRRPIISFMYRMVHNQAIAEELAQEVFLRIYRARASYRADARFTTWLYRIASNTAINHARDTKAERGSSSVYLDQVDEETGTTPDVADRRPLAEQGMLRDERMRHIRDQVMALPERQRAAVIMHKYHDMDYRQIGTVLKLSESATKSLLFRAYQTLRERLKDFA